MPPYALAPDDFSFILLISRVRGLVAVSFAPSCLFWGLSERSPGLAAPSCLVILLFLENFDFIPPMVVFMAEGCLPLSEATLFFIELLIVFWSLD